MNVTEQLTRQNRLVAWRDCNDVGRPHRFVIEQHVGDAIYWTCRDCPVSTRTVGETNPKPYLGGVMPERRETRRLACGHAAPRARREGEHKREQHIYCPPCRRVVRTTAAAGLHPKP